MSKAAKRSIVILIGLLVAALGVAGMFYVDSTAIKQEKQEVENALERTNQQLAMSEKKYSDTSRELNAQIQKITSEKDQQVAQYRTLKADSDRMVADLQSKVQELTVDRDKWKQRIDEIRKNRDDLMGKINDLTKQLESKSETQATDRDKTQSSAAVTPPPSDFRSAPGYQPETGKSVDEQYWANLIKEKAALEVDLQNAKRDLSAKNVEIVEFKQRNTDLQMEVDTLKHDKEELETAIQAKVDMIDNITLELARTKNDKKFISDRVKKLNEENGNLRADLKKLATVKNALEKSIVRLTQEKEKVQGQLGRTETIIQSKIDEIWDIKDDIDQSLRLTKSATDSSSQGGVELPPIVVNSNGQSSGFNTGEAVPGLKGKVISVNEANNFIIVDLGEQSGVRVGDNLSVYRDEKYIARVEVIQIRKDISAADLKDQWSKVKVGDSVR